jgi:sigma-B regulation protein RsbU (phosphoserine phosphatase)
MTMVQGPPDVPRHNILIVDDAPANLRVLSRMLAEQGYQVRPVLDGTLALAAAGAEAPDLILLDVRMPHMNGYEVCEHLKADEQTRDIPVIFISALDEIQDKVQAFAAGGVDYITKPFQLEEVLARVQTHLSLRKLQKQLQDANKKLEQELTLAGKVQASFLPRELPHIPDWDLAVTLEPASETSGDFYDISRLPNGRLAILMADVVDKGVGAALFMALSWTLFRTYAAQYPTQPETVLTAANRRILLDTDASQFVTVFYGILDPATGSMVYCNAGHVPPYVISPQEPGDVRELIRTGLPLGIFEDRAWEQAAVQLAPGDVMVLYTDGVTDAENEHAVFFGEDGLLESTKANLSRPAKEIRDAIVTDVHEFMGDAPQRDDMALAVVVRKPTRDRPK